MAGKRTKDITSSQTTFEQELVLLVDRIDTGSGDWLTARKLELGLLGNTYFQGSSNGVNWHNEILSTDTYFRYSTDGGSTWKLLNTDYIREGSLNKYYTEARVSANVDVLANTIARHSHTNKTVLDNIIGSGTGNNFLSDDGTYKNLLAPTAFDIIQFNTALDTPSHSEGLLFYDADKKAISYYNDEAGITVNLGQEVLIPVYNNTGVDIPNGKLVYPTGIYDGKHTVALADASDKNKSRLMAMTTCTIENGTSGYVTRLGSVGGLDTSGYISGNVVYLSATSPGDFTDVKPEDGGYVVAVGAIKVVDALVGEITIDIATTDLTVEVTDQNGFPYDLLSDSTISFVDGTRTFSISPTGTSFHYYQLGEKYKVTSTDSVVLPNETGLYAIYYDVDILSYVKNPNESQVAILIRQKTIVSLVYFNSTVGTAILVNDERHGISMSPATHSYLHFTRGAQYAGGFGIDNIIIDNGSLNSHAQFGVSAGAILDEDLGHVLDTVASTTGLTYMYKLGAAGDWYKETNSGFSFPVGATPLMQYNQWTGSTWQLTEATSGDFILLHIFATPDINKKPFSFVGIGHYATVALATAALSDEINQILAGLPAPEFVPIASIIFEAKTSLTNSVNARIVQTSDGEDYRDWRTTEIAQGTSATNHNNLAGLQLASSGSTWGHIDDQAQTLYGVKTFNSFGITPSSAPTLDYQWANKKYVDDSIGSMGSPLTTKGDIFTFSTVADRLPVGTNGQVLSADSSEATGLKWVAAGGAGTVTSIASGNGMNFTTITSSGTVTMGTPSTLTSATSNAVTSTSHTHAIITGIADTNIVKINDATVISGDYAKFTSSGLLGRSASEVKSDLSLNNVENTALSTWGGSGNIITVGTITSGIWTGTALTANYVPNHDSLNGFVANEHIDWTVSQAPTVIHADNYTNTTYVSSDFDHNSLTNTHNLTTDIDHNQLTNFVSGEHFLQTAITNVSTALSTGLLKVTTGTGILSTAISGTDYQAPLVGGTDYLRPTTDVDDTPVNGDTAQPISSNWAYDHAVGETVNLHTKLGTVTVGNVDAISKEVIGIALSSPATDLTTGTGKWSFDIPFNFIATRVYATVTTAPTGSSLQIDINDEGVSILNSVLTIAVSTNNTETSTFTGSTSSYTFTKSDKISFDVDQIGSTVAGQELTVFIEGTRS